MYGLGEHEWRELEGEVIGLFTELLGFDTSNPLGNETACARVPRDYLAGHGIESSLCGEALQRQNLVAHLRGSRPGPALTLKGHMDVVPADAGGWSVPPFAPFVGESLHAMAAGRDDQANEGILVQGVAYQALFLERLPQDLLA